MIKSYSVNKAISAVLLSNNYFRELERFQRNSELASFVANMAANVHVIR